MATSDRDIYLLSAVLHGFAATCVLALRNLASACGRTGGARIAIMEVVMAGSGANFAAAAFDMQIFMGTRGRERTLDEWLHLFDQSGLVLEEQVELRSFAKMLVLRSKQ